MLIMLIFLALLSQNITLWTSKDEYQNSKHSKRQRRVGGKKVGESKSACFQVLVAWKKSTCTVYMG